MLKQIKRWLVSRDQLSWLEVKDAFNSFTEYSFPFSELERLKWWILHRTTKKFHLVDTRLKPGYYDKDWLMLNANFAILCDFIEKELPWTVVWNDEHKSKIPWYMTTRQYVKKNAQALAFEHLQWKMEATVNQTCEGENIPISGYQVDHEGTWGWAAKEIKELYIWWKYQREKEEHEALYTKGTKLMETFEEKDDNQLIRLVKVRGFMWT